MGNAANDFPEWKSASICLRLFNLSALGNVFRRFMKKSPAFGRSFHKNMLSGLFQPGIVGDGKPFATLCTAGSQYFTPISRLHPLAKPMYRFPTTPMGLKCPFHNCFLGSAKVRKII